MPLIHLGFLICLTLFNFNLFCSVHTDAILEYFKDKDDLTMVLGAGDQEHDYTQRFKDYTFLVNTQISPERLLKSATLDNAIEELKQRLAGGQKEPLPIQLDFNSEEFFDFLTKLNGRFKEIIFDASVTKFVRGITYLQHSWGLWQINKIFEALKDGGEFYLDTGFAGGYRVVAANSSGNFQPVIPSPKDFISISPEDKVVSYIPEYGDISDYKFYADYIILQLMRNPKFDYSYADEEKIKQPPISLRAIPKIRILKNYEIPEAERLKAAKIYLTQSNFCIIPGNIFSLLLQGGKDFTAGKYATKEKSNDPNSGNFHVPNNEFLAEHIVAFLKLAGFEAEYKQDAPYPLNKPWGVNPDEAKYDFSKYTYIYARKPSALEKDLTLLKESLNQLRTKLESVSSKLTTLRETIISN